MIIGDRIRENLITIFVCTECGSNLTLTYDEQKHRNPTEGEPTGAAMRKNVIGIHPCKKCLEPVEKVKQAMKALSEIS